MILFEFITLLSLFDPGDCASSSCFVYVVNSVPGHFTVKAKVYTY